MYAEMFPSNTGHLAYSVWVVLDTLIIKQRKNLSNRELVKKIQESPYLQYFIGFSKFQEDALFIASVLVYLCKWIDEDFLAKENDRILENSAPIKEHNKDNENDRAKKYPKPRTYRRGARQTQGFPKRET